MADRAERMLLAPATLLRLRIDALAILALLAGPSGPTALHGRCCSLRCSAVRSWSRFWTTPRTMAASSPIPARATTCACRGSLATLVLNTNLHGTHHRHPNLPWIALPEAFRRDGGSYAGSYLLNPWRQLRGPIPLDAAGEPGAP